MRPALALGLIVTAAAWAMPAQAAPTVEDALAASRSIARTVIVPRYEAFVAAASGLEGASAAVCGSGGGLDPAQDAFRGAASAWASAQIVSMGPIETEERAPRIAFFPDGTNAVSRQLGALLADPSAATLDAATIKDMTVAVQGLPAIERLLFAKDAAIELVPGSPPCGVLTAASSNLAAMAREILAGWTEGEDALLKRLDAADAMSPLANTPERMFNDALVGILLVRDLKLLKPLGADIGSAKPKLSEYWRSGAGLAAVRANVATVGALVDAKDGFLALLATSGASAEAEQVRTLLRKADAELAAVTLPLDEAMLDPEARGRLVAAVETLAALRDRLVGPVATALDFRIGFNAQDGD